MELTDLVTCRVNGGQLEGVQCLVLQVENPIAVQANEVMVLVALVVEASRSARVTDSTDDAHADERMEHTIHGCPRHARQFRLYRFEDLFGGGMIGTREDCLQDGPALYRPRQTLLSAQIFELLKARSPVC